MIGLFNEPYFIVRRAKLKGLICLNAKMSLEENLQTHWKEKYAHQDEEQNSKADIPNFRVSF